MDELGALIRYHRYRAGAFYVIAALLVAMSLIPALMLPGELWQRALVIAGGLAIASPFMVHALRKRGCEIGVFEEAIVFRDRKGTTIVRWPEVASFVDEQIVHREGVIPTQAPVRAWLTTKSGQRLLVNGGPIGFENVDFLVQEIRRRVPAST